ncbi:MAG: helix-turn-helix domain-containing protein [Planctomycetota bacterium]|nr:helix-turn-helix domain-containing protein [Planctomycetota bacterium]
MVDNQETSGANSTELLTANGLARALKVSVRQVWKMLSRGDLPSPIKLGRSVRWRSAEIARWLDAGAPTRELWEQLKKAG